MMNIIIEEKINQFENISNSKIIEAIEYLVKCKSESFKFLFFLLLVFICIYIANSDLINKEYILNLLSLKKYIYDCKKSIKYERNKTYKKYPYISVCISALNMEKFIERNLLSILNQSFQDFHIIIVNDGSNDKTENIIKKFQLNDKRIKIISHSKTLGVYRSRIESIINSKSKYIILMDPDDLFLNENLFEKLYYYNNKTNLDIIEFSVLRQIEGKNKIFIPDNNFETHYHNFSRNIIYQPDLSNLLFYNPENGEYSHTICRNIWNKMIRRKIFFNLKKYIGETYFNKYIITADDMIMNIISYQFANNYSNINLPGYLYIKRKVSMSRGGGKTLKKLRVKNYLYYFQLFYKYIMDYNKDINILYYEMQNLERFIITSKQTNMTKYIQHQIKLIDKIINENILSNDFEIYLKNLSFYLKI